MSNKTFTFSKETFFSFHQGVNISDLETNKWVNDGLEKIKTKIQTLPGRDEYHCAISSGNTKVFIEAYKQDNGLFTVTVSVCKGYYKKTEIDIDLSGIELQEVQESDTTEAK